MGLNLQQTSMYFDAFLRGRNGPNNLTNPAATAQPIIDSASKITPLRPPTTHTNFIHNKPATVVQDSKVEPPRPNSSAHIFVNDFRKANPSSRSPNGCTLPSKPEINFSNNYVSFHPNRQHMPDQQKYICLSPLKPNNRTSAGLIGQEMPANRFQYRRSDSINELKFNEIYKETPSFPSMPVMPVMPQRQTIDGYSPFQNSRNTITSSPIQSHYNSTVVSNGESRVRLTDREPLDNISFTYREQERDNSIIKQPYSYRKVQKGATFYEGNHFYKLNNTIQFDSEKKRTLEHSNSQTRYLENSSYKSSGATLMPPFSEGLIRKESNTSQSSLDKRLMNSRMSDIDKSIEKDIELLRYTSRKTEEILDRELSKNTYLNQLFEQKGIKAAIDDRISVETKEKKEVAVRNTLFERVIEDQNKQLFQKTKEISQKNKTIATLSSQLHAKVEQAIKKQNEWQEKQRTSMQKIVLLQQQLGKAIERYKLIQHNLHDKIKALQRSIELKTNQYEETNESCSNLSKKILMLQLQIEKKEVQIEDIKHRNKELEQLLVKTNIELQQTTISKDIVLKQSVQKLRVAEDRTVFFEEKLKQSEEKLKIYEQRQKTHEQKMSFQEQRILSLQQSNKSLSSMNEGNKYLQSHTISLTKQISELDQQKRSIQKELQQTRKDLLSLEEKYSEVTCILLLQANSPHEKITNRLKEIMEIVAKSEGFQTKEIQRIQQYQAQRAQQELLQRRHHELTRELKRIGNRLAGASNEAQQSWRLLRDINHQIVVANLTALNDKYKHLMEN